MPKPSAESSKRIAEPGKRHRRHKELVEVVEAPPVNLSELGTGHVFTESIIASGAAGLIASNKRAQILAEEHGETFGADLVKQWTLETVWLSQLEATHRGRVQAAYAREWRPVFLAVVSLTHGIILGCQAATVAFGTVQAHREADADFDAQVLAAQAYCVQLLHSVTMRDAIEGSCEPIYWQGIRVGHVRKFDNRLRVEMLRAHMPQTFKTPGSKVNVNTGPNIFGGQNVIADAGAVRELMQMRGRSLARIAQAKGMTLPTSTPAPEV